MNKWDNESMKSVLILCTGNSCRSQMAEGFLRSLDPTLEVHSAGTQPSKHVNPFSIEVMREIDIDISAHTPKNIDGFIDKNFDYVITVCDNAKEICPVFSGVVLHRLHIGFDDPSFATGTDEFIWSEFRRVRDEIFTSFKQFYKSIVCAN